MTEFNKQFDSGFTPVRSGSLISSAEDQEENGGRLMTAFMYLRNGENDNHYAHPLDLSVHLDLSAQKVLHERTYMHKEVNLIRPKSRAL